MITLDNYLFYEPCSLNASQFIFTDIECKRAFLIPIINEGHMLCSSEVQSLQGGKIYDDCC